ncbi:hypothetical protein BMF94_0156 [Rhodotorula taiwanensis]|uniref:Glycine cleavage system H protein n=1 Tax=Rhodotorula taiwanensis TaxID=741276 RepID=A0A2S5BIH0_9BASI|nr:hypothetical protein BMF94_0156 [Rhodotorula taiwanensis]
MFRTALRPVTRAAFAPCARSLVQPSFRTVVNLTLVSLIAKRYTPEHEWVSFDDATGLGTIGITEYAQKALGDVVYVELPSVNTEVASGEEMGAVESVKAASDIFAPVSGKIAEVNGELEGQPDLLNKDAEGEGWLAKIQLSNPGEFEQLLNDEAYKAHCAGESEASD